MIKKLAHTLAAIALCLQFIGCDIYAEDVVCDHIVQEGMSITFDITSENPNYSSSRATSYGNPELGNGTEWESYINLSGNDYIFYLFDGNNVFQEILNVTSMTTEDNTTYSVTATAKGRYNTFIIIALANWKTSAWNMPTEGYAYPLLEAGISTINEIWTSTAGQRVYDQNSSNFTPSRTSHIPMYGAKVYSLNNNDFKTEEVDLGTFYMIRSLAKIDVYVSASSGITLNNVKLNRFSNYFHCAPINIINIGDEWDQATNQTMNMNLATESFSPSTLDFVKIEENLYRLYVPEYPNTRNDVLAATISVEMTKNNTKKGGTILFEGLESPSSTTKTTLNILRNNYYKFCITGINQYATDIVVDVVPFDNISNNIVFE